jgi:hypothetical protein
VSPPEAEGCGAIQELLGAYALDAVDPEEAALVHDHLANCPLAGRRSTGIVKPSHFWPRRARRRTRSGTGSPAPSDPRRRPTVHQCRDWSPPPGRQRGHAGSGPFRRRLSPRRRRCSSA